MQLSKYFFFIFLMSGLGFAQASYKIERDADIIEAKSVVQRYCQMDFQGFRLSNNTWPRLKSVTLWDEQPVWSAFGVVSGYQITSARKYGQRIIVSVTYSNYGRFEVGVGFTPELKTETIDFTLSSTATGWKVESLSPSTTPHISRARSIPWLREQVQSEKDPAIKSSLTKSLKQLESFTAGVQ